MAIITHEPAPAYNPDPNESRPNNKKRWLAAGVGGLAIGVVLWGGSKLGATTYTVENNLSSDKGTEAPAIPGETQESLVDPEFAYAIETLASMRQESADELRAQGMVIDLPEVTSDDNTSEELLGKFNADLHSVIKVAQHDTNEAERLLIGVMDPGNTDDFTRFKKDIINANPGLDYVSKYGFHTVIDWSDNFYTNMMPGVEADGSAMRYIEAETTDAVTNQITFKRDEGEWIVHKIVNNEDNDYIWDTYNFNQSIPQQTP